MSNDIKICLLLNFIYLITIGVLNFWKSKNEKIKYSKIQKINLSLILFLW